MFNNGLFGGLFDFNGDGKLDSFEKAAEFATFMELISESKKQPKILQMILPTSLTQRSLKMLWTMQE